MYSPMSVRVVRGIVAGLKENNTLHTLEINKQALSMSDITPILKLGAITTIEFTNEFTFKRESRSTRWNVEPLSWGSGIAALKEIDDEIETYVGIHYHDDNLELKFQPCNTKLIPLLRSIEYGSYTVEELDMIFYTNSNECQDVGIAIEKNAKEPKK